MNSKKTFPAQPTRLQETRVSTHVKTRTLANTYVASRVFKVNTCTLRYNCPASPAPPARNDSQTVIPQYFQPNNTARTSLSPSPARKIPSSVLLQALPLPKAPTPPPAVLPLPRTISPMPCPPRMPIRNDNTQQGYSSTPHSARPLKLFGQIVGTCNFSVKLQISHLVKLIMVCKVGNKIGHVHLQFYPLNE